MNPPDEQTNLPREQQTDKDLDQLLEQYSDSLAGKVWRGCAARDSTARQGKSNNKALDTGHPLLNQQLHTGGWPLETTTELGLSQPGVGELRLLVPALRALMQRQTSQQNIIWVAPPFLPFAPALLKEQIDVSKLVVVQCNSMQDTLWTAEQALLSECCAAVLSWTGNYNLSTRELRRLQLAAERSNSWNVLFRHSDCLKQSSAAGLRIHLKSNAYSKLELNILKQPHGWGGQKCTLSLHPHYENWQRLPVGLLPHHNRHQTPVIAQQLNSLANSDHQQATVTLLAPVAALQTVH